VRARAWDRRDTGTLLVLIAIAGLIRLPRLGRPRTPVFDEVYYVGDALRYLGRDTSAEISWVHPPLGKWVIAAGAAAVDGSGGWRIGVAVAGLVTVALTFVVARALLGTVGGACAGLFVVLDGLAIVHSRVAMLDGILAPLLLGSVVALLPLLDRGGDAGPAVLGTGRMVVAGALLGAATAVKWAAAPALAAAAICVLVLCRPRGRALLRWAVAFAVVPAAVYVAAYARYWADAGPDLLGFVDLHRGMLEFHQNLTAQHPYGSAASSWLLLRRPVAYYYEAEGGRVREILALGNPALWWGFVAASPVLLWRWWRQRDAAAELTVLAVATLWLPWVVTFRQGFSFYVTPLVPFMAIGLASVVVAPRSARAPIRLASAALVLGVVVVGVLYLPLWLGSSISARHWDRLILFDSWI